MGVLFPDHDEAPAGISFHEEDREIPDCIKGESERLRRWMHRIARDHQSKIHALHIHFCSDETLLHMNRTFLNHDYYTDILTFPDQKENPEQDSVSGDLYLSLDRIRENAGEEGVEFCEECRRVLIHGLLHLLGHDDQTDGERAEMRKRENRSLQIYDQLS